MNNWRAGRNCYAGNNEIYRYGQKMIEKLSRCLVPNKEGFYSIDADGGKYWTIGTSEGKYGEYAKYQDTFFSVNRIGFVYAKAGTEKGKQFVKMITDFIIDAKETRAGELEREIVYKIKTPNEWKKMECLTLNGAMNVAEELQNETKEELTVVAYTRYFNEKEPYSIEPIYTLNTEGEWESELAKVIEERCADRTRVIVSASEKEKKQTVNDFSSGLIDSYEFVPELIDTEKLTVEIPNELINR